MAWLPPRFWKRVRVEHSASAAVLLWPLVMLVPLIVLAGVYRTLRFQFASGFTPNPIPVMTGGNITGWANPTGAAAFRALLAEAWAKPWQPGVYVYPGLAARYFREMMSLPIAVIASACVTAGTLSLLTTSRRISGVHWKHVRRAAVYRLAPLTAFYLLFWLGELGLVPHTPVYLFYDPGEKMWLFSVGVVSLAWGFWWWRSALLIGWQMPQARTAATLIGVIDMLATLAVYCALSPFAAGSFFA